MQILLQFYTILYETSVCAYGTAFKIIDELWLYNHLDEEERAGCFGLFVFLVSRDCCGALLTIPRVCLQSVIVFFPDHTHLLILNKTLKFCFFILFCEHKLFHDCSFIQRQT